MRRKSWLVATVLLIAAAGIYVLWKRSALLDAAGRLAANDPGWTLPVLRATAAPPRTRAG